MEEIILCTLVMVPHARIFCSFLIDKDIAFYSVLSLNSALEPREKTSTRYFYAP